MLFRSIRPSSRTPWRPPLDKGPIYPKAAQALANGYFDALEMIKADPKKSFEIMGAQ